MQMHKSPFQMPLCKGRKFFFLLLVPLPFDRFLSEGTIPILIGTGADVSAKCVGRYHIIQSGLECSGTLTRQPFLLFSLRVGPRSK